MNELLTVARQALPILKPLAIKLGISVTTGVLCELGGKYARRAVAAQILSQRDKDIQAALEYHRVFTENEPTWPNDILPINQPERKTNHGIC